MNQPAPGPRLAWYGDDFTGSAAVMDELAQAGLTAVLYLAVPSPDLAARFAKVDAVGLAGTARARGTAWMDRELPGIFAWLEATGAPLLHYKICSTLDSAPETGSIGRAAEIGLARFGGWAPCLVASPSMGRWQCYGTLFARGPDGRVHRLDRHPVMATHPATPMDEADVARHLARQTDLPISLVDLDSLAARAPGDAAGIVLLDAQRQADMAPAGRILAGARLVIGSQGVETALIAHWREAGGLGPAPVPARSGPSRLAVASGSASAVTAAQIDTAEAAGFVPVALDAAALLEGGRAAGQAVAAAAAQALAGIEAGRMPVIHTARGGTDPRFAAVRQRREALGLDPADASERIGAGLGAALCEVITKARLPRAVVAGGDSSGFVAGAMGIAALTALASLDPGASLMKAHGGPLDGLEVVLKGGQMGKPDLFVKLRDGT